MNDAEERLRCWAAGVQVQLELDAARENSRHMLELLQSRADPNSSETFRTEAANYSLHIGAAELGIRDAEACGEKPVDLGWIGEFRRVRGLIEKPPTNEPDAHSQFDALDSVADWLRRDVAGLPRPGPPGRRAYGEAEMSAPGTTIGLYPFIDAEVEWDGEDRLGREEILRELGLEPKDFGDLPDRSFGALDGDTTDMLEARASRKARTAHDAAPPGPWTPPPGASYSKDDADRVQKLFEQTLGVMSEAVDENAEEQAAESIVQDIEILSREIRVAPDTIRAVLRDMGAIQ